MPHLSWVVRKSWSGWRKGLPARGDLSEVKARGSMARAWLAPGTGSVVSILQEMVGSRDSHSQICVPGGGVARWNWDLRATSLGTGRQQERLGSGFRDEEPGM